MFLKYRLWGPTPRELLGLDWAWEQWETGAAGSFQLRDPANIYAMSEAGGFRSHCVARVWLGHTGSVRAASSGVVVFFEDKDREQSRTGFSTVF